MISDPPIKIWRLTGRIPLSLRAMKGLLVRMLTFIWRTTSASSSKVHSPPMTSLGVAPSALQAIWDAWVIGRLKSRADDSLTMFEVATVSSVIVVLVESIKDWRLDDADAKSCELFSLNGWRFEFSAVVKRHAILSNRVLRVIHHKS